METARLITSFLVSFLVCMAVTPLVRGMAIRWKITEKPNGRASGDIAHIGGVAIVSAIMAGLVPVFLFFIVKEPVSRILATVLVVSGFTIFLLGVIDDLRSLHYRYKLILQAGVSLFVSFGGIFLLAQFSVLQVPVPTVFIVFLSVFIWVLAVTTSFNLIDGIDGLAAGVAAIASISFTAVGFITGQPLVVYMSIVVLGSALAFLRYNFPPAKIFMGDSGSLFFGLLLGIISLLTLITGGEIFFRISGSIMILTIPLMDTGLALLRRIINRRPLFEADLMHLHHIFLVRFRSMRKVDYMLWSLSAAFGVLGVFTIMGHIGAFYAGVLLQAVVFTRSLVIMTRSSFSREKIDDIICDYRVMKASTRVKEDRAAS